MTKNCFNLHILLNTLYTVFIYLLFINIIILCSVTRYDKYTFNTFNILYDSS